MTIYQQDIFFSNRKVKKDPSPDKVTEAVPEKAPEPPQPGIVHHNLSFQSLLHD